MDWVSDSVIEYACSHIYFQRLPVASQRRPEDEPEGARGCCKGSTTQYQETTTRYQVLLSLGELCSCHKDWVGAEALYKLSS